MLGMSYVVMSGRNLWEKKFMGRCGKGIFLAAVVVTMMLGADSWGRGPKKFGGRSVPLPMQADKHMPVIPAHLDYDGDEWPMSEEEWERHFGRDDFTTCGVGLEIYTVPEPVSILALTVGGLVIWRKARWRRSR